MRPDTLLEYAQQCCPFGDTLSAINGRIREEDRNEKKVKLDLQIFIPDE